MNTSTSALNPIQFHDDTIYAVEHDGQPYTPLRPIIENIGLDWPSQAAKLRSNRERWGVVMITTPAKNNEQHPHVCIPVCKLPGFLATINPLKVANKLRSKIVQYQNECDDVLWDYFTKGKAINPRTAGLTPAQQREIQNLITERVKDWPPRTAKRGYAAFYRAIKNTFQVGTYKDIPENRFDDLVKFLEIQEIKPTQIAEYNEHVPTVSDDFIQYIFSRSDAIAEQLRYLDTSSQAAKNIITELMRIASAMGAMYPNELRWLRFASDNETK